jgi:hypothetical protein
VSTDSGVVEGSSPLPSCNAVTVVILLSIHGSAEHTYVALAPRMAMAACAQLVMWGGGGGDSTSMVDMLLLLLWQLHLLRPTVTEWGGRA